MTLMRLAAAALAAALVASAASADPTGADALKICSADFQKACPDAKPGGGALKACARAHFMSFSSPCKSALKALRARMQQSGGANATS